MLLAVIQHNNANEIRPKTCSVWGQVNPNIVLIGPLRHYWKHQQVLFCILANSCYEECIGMCMRANPNTRANLLILHLCSSFKLSLALCSLLSNLSFSSLLIVRSLSPLCHHEWGRILKRDLMSLVFLLSIFLAYRSTFICSLSLS